MPAEVLEEVCSAEEVGKVRQFALRSYVEDSRKLTWCPAPGCEHAVECTADIGAEPLDVTCNCGSTFCFTCKEEAHRPVRLACSCLGSSTGVLQNGVLLQPSHYTSSVNLLLSRHLHLLRL